MQIGMVGLGRMGANMVRRLRSAGHDCVIYDRSAGAVAALIDSGARGTDSLAALVAALTPPRRVWLMLPAAVVERTIDELLPLLAAGDVLIDGGNSYYKDDIARAKRLALDSIHYLDVGVSGGTWGLERGYCLMIGGESAVVWPMNPVFSALAPGLQGVSRTAGLSGEPSSAEQGYLHCGGAGAGHFVKMVHNGIEYGLMAAYSEGFNLLRHAGVGLQSHAGDAETAPLREPDTLAYEIDVGAVSELWRRGSVVGSWLLDLAAHALQQDPSLSDFSGMVSDSGEGRWTSIAAIESGTPAPVLTAALFQRFSSRSEGRFADQLLSALRHEFGGHQEKN